MKWPWDNTHLDIDVSRYPGPSIVGELIPNSAYAPRECISIMKEVYGIPDGWQQTLTTTENQLFQRLIFHLRSCGASFTFPSILKHLEDYFESIVREWGLKMNAILEAWLLNKHIDEARMAFESPSSQTYKTAFLADLDNNCRAPRNQPSTSSDPIQNRLRRVKAAKDERRLS
jgi:hypothetical protein